MTSMRAGSSAGLASGGSGPIMGHQRADLSPVAGSLRRRRCCGLLDRRARPSLEPARAGRSERARAELYRVRYAGFISQHFHHKLCEQHGFRMRYTWTELRLQAAGLIAKAPRRVAHRQKRPRRPLRGMLLHQNGSPHRWLPALDAPLDLIATLDDATSRGRTLARPPQVGYDRALAAKEGSHGCCSGDQNHRIIDPGLSGRPSTTA